MNIYDRLSVGLIQNVLTLLQHMTYSVTYFQQHVYIRSLSCARETMCTCRVQWQLENCSNINKTSLV